VFGDLKRVLATGGRFREGAVSGMIRESEDLSADALHSNALG
jgi:hypothetical protein